MSKFFAATGRDRNVPTIVNTADRWDIPVPPRDEKREKITHDHLSGLIQPMNFHIALSH